MEDHLNVPSTLMYLIYTTTYPPQRPQQICSTDDAFSASGKNPTILPLDMW